MTKTHDFLPGDRLRNTINDKCGTLIGPRSDGPEGERILWDNALTDIGINWSNESFVQFLKPAPITPGSWVRVIGPSPMIVKLYAGLVAQVESITDDGLVRTTSFGEERECKNWTISNLRAVAAPTVTGVDLASGPDASVATLVVTRDNPENLEKAKQLARKLYEQLYNGSIRLALVGDGLSDVLDQIDAMTSGLVRETPLLKQARQLAEVLHAKHYSDGAPLAPFDTLSGVLDQIDNMTAALVRETPALTHRTEIIVKQRTALDEMIALIRGGAFEFSKLEEWADKYDPKPAPVFKRGDLVTWDGRGIRAIIVDLEIDVGRKHHKVVLLDGPAKGETRVWPIAELVLHVE